MRWIEKAQSGSLTWSNDATTTNIWARNLRKRLKPVRRIVKYSLLFLAFFEAPTWCSDDRAKCNAPGLPRAKLPMLPADVVIPIAISFWLFIGFSLVLRYYAM